MVPSSLAGMLICISVGSSLLRSYVSFVTAQTFYQTRTSVPQQQKAHRNFVSIDVLIAEESHDTIRSVPTEFTDPR